MLSRSDIASLQSHRDYPAISILAPTHRSSPSNRKDPIKVKNLVTKAVERLHREFPKREVADVVKNLQGLVKAVDWEHSLDGLALFASKEHAASFTLPFRVKPRAMVDETFATRDLVYAFNRAPAYRVLLLGHAPRLFEAWTTVLEERTEKPWPMTHRGPGGKAKLPGGIGVNISAARDTAMRTFFTTVDAALAVVHQKDPRPLVIVGVDRNLAFFQEVTKHGKEIAGMVTGNHDRSSPSEIAKLVWPTFEVGATVRRTDALVQLDSAVGARRSASGIDQVWVAAAAGKVKTLLVEKQFKHPADLSPAGDRLLRYTGEGPQALDDAVDEVIERVMATGGEVFFVGEDDLLVHTRIAAVLRK